jgi:hypothetical protein
LAGRYTASPPIDRDSLKAIIIEKQKSRPGERRFPDFYDTYLIERTIEQTINEMTAMETTA